MNKEGLHRCEVYEGKIGDVTVRISDGSIHCRRCGGDLKLHQVEDKCLAKINKDYKRRE